MHTQQYYFYIMTNKGNNVFYAGISVALAKRVYQHKQKLDLMSFTAKYNITKLVYYEIYYDPQEAIKREKQIKGGSRKQKIPLIEKLNPSYEDLYEKILD